MKGCIVVAEQTRFGPIPIKGELTQTLPQVSQYGFKYVELNIKNPFTLEKQEMKKLLAKNNLKVAALASGYPYFMENISFTDQRVEARELAVKRLFEYIEMASILESQVIIGSIRGEAPKEIEAEISYQRFLEALDKCLNKAKEEGVYLALEPVNRYEMNFINTVSQGLEVINTLKHPNLKLLIDTFHMNIEEPSIYESIRAARGYISHVHIADSNRWSMGCGHLDFEKILEVLTEINYNGALSAELLPMPNPEEAVKKIIEFFSKKEL
ncbi:MAG: TIM barrel protein [Bacillota bacterium]